MAISEDVSDVGCREGADEFNADKVVLRRLTPWTAFNQIWIASTPRGIQCSAMVKISFSCQIDIHFGGLDLEFSHIKSEFANSEIWSDFTFLLIYFLPEDTGRL
jgi:hypothetical protein